MEFPSHYSPAESRRTGGYASFLNYRLIIAAIGESAGSFLGGWIVPALRPAGLTAWYWCALALVGIMPAVVTNQIRKRGQRIIRH